MKRLLIILLLPVLLLGCAGEPEEFVPNQPTLPEFSSDLSPSEQLEAAVAKTRLAKSMVLTFGLDDALTTQAVTVGSDGSYTSLLEAPDHSLYHSGTACFRSDSSQEPPAVEHSQSDAPYTRAEIFQEVSALFPAEGLLERFCAQPLFASPNNDGSYCYQLTELSVSDTYALIHGTQPDSPLLPEEYGGICSVSVSVDPEGYFSQFLVQVYVSDAAGKPLKTHTLQLTLTGLDSDLSISPPEWAVDG